MEKHWCVSSSSAPSSSALRIAWKPIFFFFFRVLAPFSSCVLFTEDGLGFVGGIAN